MGFRIREEQDEEEQGHDPERGRPVASPESFRRGTKDTHEVGLPHASTAAKRAETATTGTLTPAPERSLRPAPGSLEVMGRIVKGLLDRFFFHTSSAWLANELFLITPIGRMQRMSLWSVLAQQCEAISSLARTGLHTRANYAIQQLFRGLDRAVAHQDPGFLVYAWGMSLALRNIRLHGGQIPLKNKFPLLRIFFRYLRVLFIRTSQDHPFFYFTTWLEYALVTSPKDFKSELGWAYAWTITCFREKIGDYHPVAIHMLAHMARNWTNSIRFPAAPIQARYTYLCP